MSSKLLKHASVKRGRTCISSLSETPPDVSLNTSKLRDLSTARLERKRHLTVSSQVNSLSSENLATASKVLKVASAWSLMKEKMRDRGASSKSIHTSMNDSEISSASHLVNVIKATSNPIPMKSTSRLASQASTKKMLYKKKAASPKSVTPVQGDELLSKLLQFTGDLALSSSDAKEKKEEKHAQKPRQVIEVSLFAPRKPAATPDLVAPDPGTESAPKSAKPKARLIEVSMASR